MADDEMESNWMTLDFDDPAEARLRILKFAMPIFEGLQARGAEGDESAALWLNMELRRLNGETQFDGLGEPPPMRNYPPMHAVDAIRN